MKSFILALMLTSSLCFGKTITLNSSNTINFNQPFGQLFIAKKQVEAMRLCAAKPNSEIYIVLYTPGGSVSAGQLFFDTLAALPCKFHTITIFSASMGYITVQTLGTRYILPSGTLMSHRASIRGLSGEIGGELDVMFNLLKTSIGEITEKVAKRVGMSVIDYEKLIADELWLTGQSAVDKGHADELALVKCDKSLSGTYVTKLRTIFGVLDAEFSKCPIITAPIRLQQSKNSNKVLDYYRNISKFIKMEL